MTSCRLTIHADGDPVDVVVPETVPVASVLPEIAVLARAGDGVHRRLARLSGELLDDAESLRDNGIRDGDTLLLVAHLPPPARHRTWDAARDAVLAPTTPPQHLPDPGAAVVLAAAVATCVFGTTGPRWPFLAGALVIAVAAAAAAVARGGTAPRLAAVGSGAAVGFLCVPGGPGAGNAFLAAAVAATAAVVFNLVATASFSMIVAVATGPAVAWQLPPHTVGAVLATTAVALLTVAPRIAAIASSARGVEVGHAHLDALVTAAAAGVAVGAGVVATTAANPLPGTVFCAVLAAATLLRSRAYADATRRVSLLAAGICCAAALVVVLARLVPVAGPWACALFALGTLGACGRAGKVTAGVTVGRVLDVAEWAVVGAVLPVACWLGGAYAAARGWHVA